MENFLLIKKQYCDNQLIDNAFERHFPGSVGIRRNFGEFDLFLFRKQIKFPMNFHEENGFFIGAFGTPIYKKFSYTKGLQEILKDELNKRFFQENLCGHYYIFIWNRAKLKILNDGSGLLNVYYNEERQCISSSFLILTEIGKSFTINKLAFTENVFTGGITGSETILNEIKILKPGSKYTPEGLNVNTPGKFDIHKTKNKKESFELQIETLENYFQSIKNLADEFGVDTGLTGGLDSRLVLGLVRKYFSRYQVHSHSRSTRNSDLEIASEIAKDLNIKFVSSEVVPWIQKSEEEKQSTFKEAMMFCDGQIREHCYWNEDYNTVSYREKVIGGLGLGLQGIGGEQYRNGERMLLKNFDFENWVKFKHIGKFSGETFIKDPLCNELTSNIKGKISEQLGFGNNKKNITLLDLKRINNEVLIPSFRGIRTNSENRISFSLSPFADYKVSQTAYSVAPFLNLTYNFEMDLVKHFAPDLAGYKSTYGYSFDSREPFPKYAIPVLVQNFIPFSLLPKFLGIYKTFKHKRVLTTNTGNEEFLRSCVNNLRGIDLHFNFQDYLNNSHTSTMVYSLGYLIGELKSKLR